MKRKSVTLNKKHKKENQKINAIRTVRKWNEQNKNSNQKTIRR